LRRGDQDRFAFNIITGDYQGYRIQIFDYHYQTVARRSQRLQLSGSSDQGIKDHEFSAVLVETGLNLRELSIRPSNGTWRSIGDFFGNSGVQFELGAFNQEFFVDAADPRWAYNILPQSTLEYLLNAPRYEVDVGSKSLLAQRSKLLDPPQCLEALELMIGILKRIPQDVLRELNSI